MQEDLNDLQIPEDILPNQNKYKYETKLLGSIKQLNQVKHVSQTKYIDMQKRKHSFIKSDLQLQQDTSKRFVSNYSTYSLNDELSRFQSYSIDEELKITPIQFGADEKIIQFQLEILKQKNLQAPQLMSHFSQQDDSLSQVQNIITPKQKIDFLYSIFESKLSKI